MKRNKVVARFSKSTPTGQERFLTRRRRSIRQAIFLALAGDLVSSGIAADFNFSHLWTFNHVAANGSKSLGAEILSYDTVNRRLWVVGTDANADAKGFGGIDVINLDGSLAQAIDTTPQGTINSVSVHQGKAAVAISAPVKTDNGQVRIYDTSTFNSVATIQVGANPDALIFSPNGSKILVANEGEPSSYLVGPSGDPKGSVSIIDSNTYQVQTAGFEAFDSQAAALKAAGVRLTGPNASVSQDLEPEFIAVSADSSRAIVTLQEANSVAIVDIATALVTAIQPLPRKDHSLPGNGLDASDRDGAGNAANKGNIQNWNVVGVPMPDGIAAFNKAGTQYYVTANEGDSRADWPGGNDEVRVADLTIDPALDAALDAAHGTDWQTNNDKLNRLNATTSGDLDGDGDQDQIQVFGSRSFSILDANGVQIFDSGDQIEQIIKAQFPSLWDDSRSDNKGPEPESAVVGTVDGRDLLFLGLERSNSIMVWDLTDLSKIDFRGMISTSGDVGPEGLSLFQTPDGDFLAVANEVSETTTLYSVNVPDSTASQSSLVLSLAALIALRRHRSRPTPNT